MRTAKTIAKWFLIVFGGTWAAITIGVMPYFGDGAMAPVGWLFWFLVPVRLVVMRSGLWVILLSFFLREKSATPAPDTTGVRVRWW